MEYTERVVEIFYDKLLHVFCLDDRARLVWVGVKAYAQQHPEYIRTEEGKCLWLLDELVELYQLSREQINEVYWIYQQAKVEAWEQPSNG